MNGNGNGYMCSPQCIMLATHCAICGRPLVDARSVERGIGPECWETHGLGDVGSCEVSQGQRELCNKLTYAASVYARQGQVSQVIKCAAAITAIGLETLGDLVASRFTKAAEKAKIRIRPHSREADRVVIETPFRRGAYKEFLAAWRAIPGRKFVPSSSSSNSNPGNSVPRSELPRVWELLTEFFPGKYGINEDGSVFRVVEKEEALTGVE